MPMLLAMLLFALFTGPVYASTAPEPSLQSDDGLFDRKSKEEEEGEIDDAEQEELRKKREKQARVVVLKWDNTSTDYKDETVKRNVKSRIDRPDAMFFPSTDLFQRGRKHPDETLEPRYQPAEVPTGNLDVAMDEVRKISQIPWDAKSPAEWQLIARELIKLTDSLWFLESVEQREPIFMLYAYIGYAAENGNNPAPPFYEGIGNQSVNYYYYLAATLAWQDASLMSKINDNEIRGVIAYYLDQIQSGGFPVLALDFELENVFVLEDFDKEYEVFLNGLKVEDINERGQYEVPLGRLDIYLKRKDSGHGLSDQLKVDKYKDKAYFVRDEARKKMGSDLYKQLMLHPNECTPALDGDILNYLAIYAKLHKLAEIYIAVPRNGDPNKVYIWRYDRPSATLQLVAGDNDDFPVRFAFVASTGVVYNGAAFSVDSSVDNGDLNTILDPDPASQVANRLDYDLKTGHLPLNLELRGHYNRLMVEVGMEFGYNLSAEGLWVERYRTPEHKAQYGHLIVVDAEGAETPRPEVYHYKAWSRYTYGGVGVVLKQNASLGFGPRFSVRAGVSDIPWAFVSTGHFGWTLEPPIDALKSAKRVRPLIDFDARLGAAVAMNGSVQRDIAALEDEERFVKPVFGITAGIGTTF